MIVLAYLDVLFFVNFKNLTEKDATFANTNVQSFILVVTKIG